MTGWANCHNDLRTSYSEAIGTDTLQLNTESDAYSINRIQEALLHGDIDVVSDGSFCPSSKTGAAGWVIATKDSSAQITGSKGTVGPTTSQSACRSEMSGILYVILHLNTLCENLTLNDVHITLHCDGLSAIQSINNAPNDTSCSKKNFDIINSINTLRPNLPFTFGLQHIKGHQDEGAACHRLSKLVQLNVQADDIAKSALKSMSTSGLTLQTTCLPFIPCDVLLYADSGSTTKICTNLVDSIRYKLTLDSSRQYWINKKELENTSSNIDWNLRSTSMKNVNKSQQR